MHGSTDCSLLHRRGLLSTKGDAAAREGRQRSRSAKPLGKRAETPQSRLTDLREKRCCPRSRLSALPLPPEAGGGGDRLPPTAAHQEARGFELTADKQQAKTGHLLYRLSARAAED